MHLSGGVITILIYMTSMASAINLVSPSSEEFNLPSEQMEDLLYNFLYSSDFMQKRSVASMESIIEAVNNSGLIFTALEYLANNEEELNMITNLTAGILENSTDSSGVNINISSSLNISTIIQDIKDSGLVTSVLDGLLMNDDNREYLTTILGDIIEANPWITKILVDISAGVKPTVSYIAHTITTYRSKDPDYNSHSYYSFYKYESVLSKRSTDNYNGSAEAFLNNLISSVMNSDLATNSFNDFLVALNDSGVALSVTLELLNNTDAAYIGGYVIKNLYEEGALDNIDINKYFQKAKSSHLLSDSLQKVLTNPTYEPYLALVFKQLEDTGVYKSMQRSLFGDV